MTEKELVKETMEEISSHAILSPKERRYLQSRIELSICQAVGIGMQKIMDTSMKTLKGEKHHADKTS